jgi:hypothetical protein
MVITPLQEIHRKRQIAVGSVTDGSRTMMPESYPSWREWLHHPSRQAIQLPLVRSARQLHSRKREALFLMYAHLSKVCAWEGEGRYLHLSNRTRYKKDTNQKLFCEVLNNHF